MAKLADLGRVGGWCLSQVSILIREAPLEELTLDLVISICQNNEIDTNIASLAAYKILKRKPALLDVTRFHEWAYIKGVSWYTLECYCLVYCYHQTKQFKCPRGLFTPFVAEAMKLPLLYAAASIGDFQRVMHILTSKPGLINEKLGKMKHTPLFCAVRACHPGLVRWLLEHGADQRIPNLHGHTPLMEACLDDSREISELLLDDRHGTEALAIQNGRECPIRRIAIHDAPDLLRRMLGMHQPSFFTLLSTARIAIRHGRPAILRVLLKGYKLPALPIGNMQFERSLFYYAMCTRHHHSCECVRLVAQCYDFDIHKVRKEADTMKLSFLHYCVVTKCASCLAYFLQNTEAAQYLEAPYWRNEVTPLMYAAEIATVEVISVLVQHGANVYCRIKPRRDLLFGRDPNQKCRTCMEVAATRNTDECRRSMFSYFLHHAPSLMRDPYVFLALLAANMLEEALILVRRELISFLTFMDPVMVNKLLQHVCNKNDFGDLRTNILRGLLKIYDTVNGKPLPRSQVLALNSYWSDAVRFWNVCIRPTLGDDAFPKSTVFDKLKQKHLQPLLALDIGKRRQVACQATQASKRVACMVHQIVKTMSYQAYMGLQRMVLGSRLDNIVVALNSKPYNQK